VRGVNLWSVGLVAAFIALGLSRLDSRSAMRAAVVLAAVVILTLRVLWW
jgi:hypothetical protein